MGKMLREIGGKGSLDHEGDNTVVWRSVGYGALQQETKVLFVHRVKTWHLGVLENLWTANRMIPQQLFVAQASNRRHHSRWLV